MMEQIEMIIEKTFPYIKKLFSLFSVYKLFLILLYVTSDIQHFTHDSTIILLRLLLFNDSFLIFFSGLNIYVSLKIKNKIEKIFLSVFSIISLIFCIITISISLIIIIFSK